MMERLFQSVLVGLLQAKLKKAEVQAAAPGDEFPVKGIAHGVKIWGKRFTINAVLVVEK